MSTVLSYFGKRNEGLQLLQVLSAKTRQFCNKHLNLSSQLVNPDYYSDLSEEAIQWEGHINKLRLEGKIYQGKFDISNKYISFRRQTDRGLEDDRHLPW